MYIQVTVSFVSANSDACVLQVTITAPADPAYPADEIYGIVGDNLKKNYDVKEVDHIICMCFLLFI